MKNLFGKRAFIAGVADDKGFGWAIAKSLAEDGCEIIIGTWVPVVKIFKHALLNNKLNTELSDGTHLNISKIYPMDGAFDSMDDVPASLLNNKRYKGVDPFTISDVAKLVEKDFGKIDFLIHSLANAPEVQKPLLETSRQGYLDAVSASSYSFVSMVKHFSPHMNKGGSILNLSYVAASKIVPGYGGGMSSAKAALESDTRTLAYEVGRKYGLRVNAISAGPLESRAAKAIGFIEKMTEFAKEKAPLQDKLSAEQVGNTARFLLSSDASAITASTIFVDHGLHAMGPALDEEKKQCLSQEKQSLLHPAPLE